MTSTVETNVTTRVPYDPELGAALSASPLPTVITAEMIGELRSAVFGPPIEELLATRDLDRTDHVIEGPNGEVVLSVLRPRGVRGAVPGIYFTHGGGMVIGDRFTGIDDALDWADRLGAVLVTVEYRLAPEHPDPAPVQDAYAGLVWTAQHAGELGIDLDRLMVAGTSAGAGIAAGLALMARDLGGPRLVAQLLRSPMLDDRDVTVSSAQYSQTGSWSRESNNTGWDALLGDRRKSDAVSVYAAPARAGDLSGLPPAFVDVGSAEVFRDEAVAYASRLWAAGVQAELHVWPGGFHIFDGAVPSAVLSKISRSTRDAWITRTLTTTTDQA